MNDWIGLIFIFLLIAGGFFGLRALSRSRPKSEEEFEKGAAESASLLTAGVEALNGMLNPSAAKGKETVEEIKRGEHIKKPESGEGFGESK